jgi:hypothetical protein
MIERHKKLNAEKRAAESSSAGFSVAAASTCGWRIARRA